MVYSAASALTILYLSRKPIHLDQYSPLIDNNEDEDAEDDLHHDRNASTIQRVQAQYQEQRSSGLSINLARLGLTVLQLGLALLSIILFKTGNKDRSHDTERISWGDIVKVTAWSYALVLSFIHVLRPQIAHQFWIRPQMDMFYVLETALLLIQLYVAGIFGMVPSDWSLWIKLDIVTLTGLVLLLGVSTITLPYRPIRPFKKPKEGEAARLPSIEYSSSFYSQFAFAWVNPLVYLGFRRPLSDIDLPDIEPEDYSAYSIKRYDLVK